MSFKNILVMSEAWMCCLLVPPCSSGLFSSPCCVFLLFSLWLRCVNHSLPAIGWRVCVKKVAREALSQQISLRAEPTSAPTRPPLLLKIKIARAALTRVYFCMYRREAHARFQLQLLSFFSVLKFLFFVVFDFLWKSGHCEVYNSILLISFRLAGYLEF